MTEEKRQQGQQKNKRIKLKQANIISFNIYFFLMLTRGLVPLVTFP